MPDNIAVAITATVVHKKATSACCAVRLDRAPAEAPHDYTCQGCGQPAERVLTEHKRVPAAGYAVIAAPAADGGEL